MTTKREQETMEHSDHQHHISKLSERQARAESDIGNLKKGLDSVKTELGGMNTTLGHIEKAVVTLAATPQPKAMSENIRTIATTVAIVATVCSAIWWAILTAVNPVSATVVTLQAEVIETSKKQIGHTHRIESLEKRLNKVDQFDG